MTDYRAILGGDYIDGDSGAVSALADYLSSRANLVEHVQSDLLANGKPGTWSGKAADGFAHALGDLPGELHKLLRSFHHAAGALRRYAHELHAHKLLSHELAQRIEAEETARGTAHAGVTHAQHALTTATGAYDIAHPTAASAKKVSDASDGVAAAKARYYAIQHEIDDLRTAAHRNRSSFEDAVKLCEHRLGDAGNLGIKNRHYNILQKVEHFFAALPGEVYKLIKKIPFDEISHELGLDSLGLLAVVVLAGALTAVSDGVAAPAFIASLDLLEGVGSAKIAADIGGVATGKEKADVLLEDVLSLGVGKGASAVLSKKTVGELEGALNKAMDAAERTHNHGQERYVQGLLDELKGQSAKDLLKVGAEIGISKALAKQINQILSQDGCTTHTGSK